MKAKLIIVFLLIYLAFLTPKLLGWLQQPSPEANEKPVHPAYSPLPPTVASAEAAPQNVLFNLGGEWRGKLEPLHGQHLDPRDWALELRFFIRGDMAQVFIWRGSGWQEIKPGQFHITHHKSNAILHSIDSGNGWVESWVFSLSRRDEDSLYVYANRIINNVNMAPNDPRSRITYGATAVFTRSYDRFKQQNTTDAGKLSDEEIAAQFSEASERAARLSGEKAHGVFSINTYRVVREKPDAITLAVKYHYEGLNEDRVYIGAVTQTKGQNTSHWRYRPVKVLRGENIAEIEIGMNSKAPDNYCSDALRIKVYESGKSTFFDDSIDFNKCWQKNL
jgi:hypothetical protein